MRAKLFLMLLSFVLVVGVPQVFGAEGTLNIITEDRPPYNYKENGKIKGFSTEIVQAILE